jgi:hypothetical protein
MMCRDAADVGKDVSPKYGMLAVRGWAGGMISLFSMRRRYQNDGATRRDADDVYFMVDSKLHTMICGFYDG